MQFVKIKLEEISCTNSAVIPKMHFFHWYSNLSYENSAILYFMNRFKIWYEFRLNLSSFCQRGWHFYLEIFLFYNLPRFKTSSITWYNWLIIKKPIKLWVWFGIDDSFEENFGGFLDSCSFDLRHKPWRAVVLKQRFEP